MRCFLAAAGTHLSDVPFNFFFLQQMKMWLRLWLQYGFMWNIQYFYKCWFFFLFFFFFQRLEDWISRDPFLMIWRQRLSFRKDEMNTEGGLCWQCLNGCFLPPSRPVFCARFSAAPPPPTTSTIHPLSLLFFSCFIVIPSGLLQHPSWPKSTR